MSMRGNRIGLERRRNGFVVAIAVACGTIAPVQALAQSIPWNAPVDGLWNVGANWTGGNIPDANAETAVLGHSGQYQVLVNGAYQIGALQVTNAEAILAIAQGQSLTVQNSISLVGAIVVNAEAGGANTALRFSRSLPGAVALTGTGTIYLNSFAGNLDCAYLTSVNNTVTSIGPTVTVRGIGRMYGRYVHSGEIIADDLFGGVLDLSGVTMQGTGALRADATTLQIQGSTLTGTGAGMPLTAVNGGTILVHNGTTQFSGVSVTGPMTISGATLSQENGFVTGNMRLNAGSTLRIASPDFTLNGNLLVNHNGSGSATQVRFTQTGSLLGAGTITLNCNTNNLDTAYLATDENVLTILPAGRVIDGSGRVYGRYQLGGLFRATDTLFSRPFELVNVNIAGTGTAVFEAVGAPFQISGNNSIANVAMTASAGGTFRVHNGTTQLTNVSLTGPLTISGATLRQTSGIVTGNVTVNAGSIFAVVSPDFALNGNLLLNHNGAAASTGLRFEQTGSLPGSGTITLNCNQNDLDTAYVATEANVTMTIPVGRVIEGAGRIYGRYQLGGIVRANDAALGRALDFASTTVVGTGTAVFEAAGASLRFRGDNQITNVAMAASGNTEFLAYSGTTQFTDVSLTGTLRVSGATLRQSNGTVTGKITVDAGSNLAVTSQNFTHNGDMVINPSAAGANTVLYFSQTGTLLGSGTITLNANANNFDTAYITTESNAVVTLPVTRTIAGSGRIYARMIHNGTLAPSNISLFSPIGRIELANVITLTPSASVEIDMASPTSFDQIAGNGVRTLAGALKLRLVNGFVARPADTMAIITGGGARTGTFGTIVPPSGYAAQATYTSTGLTVSLSRTCPADLNSDGMVDDADFSIFVVAYNVLDCEDSAMPAWCPADINNDHLVDDADFSIFVGAYDMLLCP